MRILFTEEFKRQYNRLLREIQKKADKQQRLFRSNPSHPSLNTEKLTPKERGLWTFRVDRAYRIAFRHIDGATILALAIGPHDWIYKIFR